MPALLRHKKTLERELAHIINLIELTSLSFTQTNKQTKNIVEILFSGKSAD